MEAKLLALLMKYEQPVRVAVSMLRRNGEGTAQGEIAKELEAVLGEVIDTSKPLKP